MNGILSKQLTSQNVYLLKSVLGYMIQIQHNSVQSDLKQITEMKRNESTIV